MDKTSLLGDGYWKPKNEICRAADEIDVNNSGNFVGSHPMAGSENSGMEFGNPGILKGKNV